MAVRGTCSSPLSSVDGDDSDTPRAASFPDFLPSPSPSPVPPRVRSHARAKSTASTALGKQKQKQRMRGSEAKRRLTTQPSQRPAKLTTAAKRGQQAAASWKSTKELVREAPQEFVEYLAGQLTAAQQTHFAAEFGGGQGYMVRLPPSSWQRKSARDKFAEWVRSLGFSSTAALSRNVLRAASLKADVIISELHARVHPASAGDVHEGIAPSAVATSVVNTDAISDAATSKVSTEDRGETATAVDYANDPQMVRLKEYFKELESQKIEVLSYSENLRLLSSSRHMEIADAMEAVLAQPSVRRDRRQARRLSQLGRVSGRRLSSILVPPLSTTLAEEDDWVWDAEMDKMSLTPVKRRISLGEGRRSTKKKTKNVLGKTVLHLVLQSGFVAPKVLKKVLRHVSTMWKKISVAAYAWAIADYSKKPNVYSMAQVYLHYPRGHYLSDGTYKEVFKVFSTQHKRLEAVSVMDIKAIESTGNQAVVRHEVAHSLLLSDAAEHGVCPNFLEIYDVFLAHERPRQDRWGSAKCRKPTKLLSDKKLSVDPNTLIKQQQRLGTQEELGLFQFIRMEFCDGGDVEDFIGLQDNKLLPVESVALPFFFQMVFGLYCAREKFSLRHCDVKLLNFFLKDVGRSSRSKKEGADLVLHYLFEDSCFELRMPASFSYWVKLADYGSADSNADNLGKPVTIDQFTTLENTPIEFLLEGDEAQQSYASDTFSLGLCLLHLFTGSAPYEETLEDVHCPAALLKDLKLMWMSPRKKSGFSVIKSVVREDHEDALYHTLYRYIVLFGLPGENPSEERGIDKVWQVLLKHLRPEDASDARPQRTTRRTAAASTSNVQSQTDKDIYERDRALYSVASGSDPIMRRCRTRLASTPGASALLKKLVDFNPSQRPTLKQVLYDPMLSMFRSSAAESRAPADHVVDYYKSTSVGYSSLPDM